MTALSVLALLGCANNSAAGSQLTLRGCQGLLGRFNLTHTAVTRHLQLAARCRCAQQAVEQSAADAVACIMIFIVMAHMCLLETCQDACL